jgi:hypothetical protein
VAVVVAVEILPQQVLVVLVSSSSDGYKHNNK